MREALSLAYDAHAGQARKSGEAFITHPVEVCRILAELRMDFESLVAGGCVRDWGSGGGGRAVDCVRLPERMWTAQPVLLLHRAPGVP